MANESIRAAFERMWQYTGAQAERAAMDVLRAYVPDSPSQGGRSIVSILRTGGDGSPGTTDTYTITYTDGTTDSMTVYNGNDGATGPQGLQGEKGDTGATGPQGAAGADGYTPVKGVDYFTAADKAELVSAVLAALPAAEEVSV